VDVEEVEEEEVAAKVAANFQQKRSSSQRWMRRTKRWPRKARRRRRKVKSLRAQVYPFFTIKVLSSIINK
jgi:hypothetical protein